MGASVSRAFAGTERFRVLRQLGEGGMGVVYEVEDRDRDSQRVALKTLKTPDPESLYRLKWEFRSLAGIRHPSILQLHELIVEGERCFLTMELVEGVDLVAWVASGSALPPEERYARLRSIFDQLVQAVVALHQSGKVHRDIKPANVLVTPEGRVVLLDFGLVAPFADASAEPVRMVGTIGYMAPEQALDEEAITGAADWYAVGVTLFQALTGRLPFEGTSSQILEGKLIQPAPAVSTLAGDAPRDLAELCADLLAIEPGARPTGEQILERLEHEAPRPRPEAPSEAMRAAGDLVGRRRELALACEALDRVVDTRRPSVIVLCGEAGLGKSSLVRAFLHAARGRPGSVMALEGRCYEREHLPFKAMDSLVDRLSAEWLLLSDDEARSILPAEPALLPALFPVLGRIPAIDEASSPASRLADPQVMRTRAFEALRQVFQHIGQRRPLVLVLDDMQWADEATLLLLADLMRPPDPPRLLLVLVCRPEGVARIGELVVSMAARAEEIALQPLDEADARAVVQRIVGDLPADVARRIASESSGNPFFVTELAEYARRSGGKELDGMGLEQLLNARLGELPERSHRLLDVLSVAGKPLTRQLVGSVLGVSEGELRLCVDGLRDQRLLRDTGEKASDRVEIYHDLIRARVAHRLSPEAMRETHRCIARAIEETGDGAHEQLARHWLGAGRSARAAECAQLAADAALKTFDFDRAARLYRVALDVGTLDSETRHRLAVAHAECLSYAGKPAEAARAFDVAAEGATEIERLDMTRRAVEQLLRGGYVAEGFERMRALLAAIGVPLLRSAFWSLVVAMVLRVRIQLRGRRRSAPRERDLAPARLARLDALFSVTVGLYAIDILRATEFEGRFILQALATGDPRRVAAAFGIESLRAALTGNEARARLYAAEGLVLAEQTGHRGARFLAAFARGAAEYYCTNDWRCALGHFRGAEAAFVASGGGAGWEADNSQVFSMWCLLYLGELVDLARAVAQGIREAQRRGDRYAEVCLRTRFVMLALVRDEPAEGYADVNAAVASWLQTERFLIPHFYALHSRCEVDLYTGNAERAREELERNRTGLFWSLSMTIPMVKMEIFALDARITLLECERGVRARGRAASLARRLDGLGMPLSRALALLVRATLARQRGEREQARSLLEQAIAGFESTETLLHAHVAKRRLGELTGEPALVEEADAWMRGCGVFQPARVADAIAPGWGRARARGAAS
jgi:hypothetical protein